MTFVGSILSILNSAELPSYLKTVDDFIWGPPLLLLLVGTGVFFTFSLGFIQIKHLPLALKYVFGHHNEEKGSKGDVSSFGALTLALAATIGTGNIVGVVTAIKVNGLMVIPNLIALDVLIKVVISETKEYFSSLESDK